MDAGCPGDGHDATHDLRNQPAADDRLGSLKEWGQHWRSETVAELGGAVLLRLLGFDHEADLGGSWCYVQRYALEEDSDTRFNSAWLNWN